MQFYLTALDRQVREEGENSSIGIILCKEKSRTIVEYALHDARKPIGVATYRIVKLSPTRSGTEEAGIWGPWDDPKEQERPRQASFGAMVR